MESGFRSARTEQSDQRQLRERWRSLLGIGNLQIRSYRHFVSIRARYQRLPTGPFRGRCKVTLQQEDEPGEDGINGSSNSGTIARP